MKSCYYEIQEVFNIIKSYYRKQGVNVEVEALTHPIAIGRSICCMSKLNIIEKTNLPEACLGQKTPISRSQLLYIFNKYLENTSYVVNSLQYDVQIGKTRCSSKGDVSYETHLNGVVIYYKEKKQGYQLNKKMVG